ncbi:MAG: amino acid ABC transporter permease [Thermoleophilaceae bacterium]|nr:amino acid ABC transporter permease [Thermoleophilaceae bacterium]
MTTAVLFAHWPDWIGDLSGGLLESVKLTAAISAVGLPLGLLLAMGSSLGPRPLRWLSIAVVEVARGVPALVVLYLVYFGLPQAHLTLEAFVAATIALGFTMAGYTAEIFRAGINAVPDGQREAARAVGLRRGQELLYVVLPQAVRIVIPPILGYVVLFFQATSLAFAVAIPELISRAYTIGSSTFEYLNVLILAALLYAAIAIPASQLVDWLERRRDRLA